MEEDIVKKLFSYDKKDYIMAASCSLEGHIGESAAKEIGLVSGHAYSLIAVEQVKNRQG